MSNAEVMAAIIDKSEGKIKFNTTPQKLGRLLTQCGFTRCRRGNERGWKIKVKKFDPFEDEKPAEVPF